MNIKDFINDNIILITPNNKKEELLLKINEFNSLYNIKIFSMEEFIENITFTFDEKALLYVIEKYNLKYLVAKEYLDNIKYVNKSFNEKTKFLCDLKKDLEKENLIIYNELFKDYIKNKKIIIYDYNHISSYEKKLLEKYDYKIVEEPIKNYSHKIYEFKSIEDEIEFVASKICGLIKKKIDINKIKIIGVNDSYNLVIKRIFSYFNINIDIESKDSIYSTKICKTFLELLKNNNINASFKTLMKQYNLNNKYNENIYNQILSVINKYYFENDFSKIIYILKEEFKRVKIKTINHLNSVKLIDISSKVEDDEYVFLVGFNQGEFPKIFKNEDFFSDEEKEILLLDTSINKNIYEKIKCIKSIKNIKNLTISYKLNTRKEECFISSLINDLDFEIIKNNEKSYMNSNIYNKLSLSENLDNYLKYGEIDKDLKVLYSNYSDINYKSYINKYSSIDKKKYLSFINNNINLSYTSMNDYYTCAFKYYLKYILKLNSYEETFMTIIGNLFHYILSICFLDNFDFNEEYENYIKKYEFTNKEKFYINKLKEDLLFVIKTIKKQYSHTEFNNALYEEEIVIQNEMNNVTLTFKGYIDKILYKEEKDRTLVVIIDYKTGNPELNLNNSIYGLNMQLPVYIYLASNSNKIKNAKVIGFYLQKILLNGFKSLPNKTYKSQKEDSLKLQGYTISNESLMGKIDETYENSEVIKSLKKGKNGFYSYSKIISEENINKLLNLTEEKVNKAFNNIINAEFQINPKSISNKNISCQYCEYKDICFKTEDDTKALKEYKT